MEWKAGRAADLDSVSIGYLSASPRQWGFPHQMLAKQTGISSTYSRCAHAQKLAQLQLPIVEVCRGQS